MIETKFTPGPWVAEKTMSGRLAVYVPNGPEADNETHDANIRLMAATPELYEALAALRDRLT